MVIAINYSILLSKKKIQEKLYTHNQWVYNTNILCTLHSHIYHIFYLTVCTWSIARRLDTVSGECRKVKVLHDNFKCIATLSQQAPEVLICCSKRISFVLSGKCSQKLPLLLNFHELIVATLQWILNYHRADNRKFSLDDANVGSRDRHIVILPKFLESSFSFRIGQNINFYVHNIFL